MCASADLALPTPRLAPPASRNLKVSDIRTDVFSTHEFETRSIFGG